MAGVPQHEKIAFAHPGEVEFARILDFYGVRWAYEPRACPLRWDDGLVTEMFAPDFFLEDLNLYVELTTLKQNLVTEKNGKLRRLRQLYPDLQIKLLYRKDYHRLLAKYGFGPLGQDAGAGVERILLTTATLRQRVTELGTQIWQDYARLAPVSVGVLKGVMYFMADLTRQVSLPLSIEFMSIAYFAGNGGGAGHQTLRPGHRRPLRALGRGHCGYRDDPELPGGLSEEARTCQPQGPHTLGETRPALGGRQTGLCWLRGPG